MNKDSVIIICNMQKSSHCWIWMDEMQMLCLSRWLGCVVWSNCWWGSCGIKDTMGVRLGKNTPYGVVLVPVESLQDEGFQVVVNAGRHLQTEKGKVKMTVLQLDHVLGGGDHPLGPTGHGFLLELLQDAGRIALMILETVETAQADTLFGQALPKGLGSGNPAKTIEWRRQGREGKWLILLFISDVTGGIVTEKNRFVGKTTLQEGCEAFCSFPVGRSSAGEQKGVTALERGNGFPQIATGKDPAVAGQ